MELNASEPVTYTRPGSAAIPTDAIVGRSITEQDSASGFIMKIVSRDFTIRQANLPGITKPNRNDEIRQTINGTEYLFLVDGGSGQAHYEDTDGYGVAWRIHTKLNSIG